MAKKKVEEVIEEENVDSPTETVEKIEVSKDEKFAEIDRLFAKIEDRILHGSVEQMNDQASELLSLKIKVKRLF
jgi:hypothetical protein